ncbi:MAG: toll/interleukin-1 receptor domain-containing protein [Blastocatellia bacterium]|nr:toll/interleukin-1 receptor domain-containing protein [Blastocatellia bacterium]
MKHEGPSHVSIDTLYKSKGEIPEAFLRGCGVPDNFIEYMHSLTNQAFEYYSCFISYSSKNHDFAERIYADLQNKGVRCWFAPEDMKIGDKIRTRIDETIRKYDKLLLVLSEESVASQWVEAEVEAAIEKEEDGKTVLFPVRLDDAVMKLNTGWPALIKRTRHIGDFTQWQTHSSYQKAFARLMRDLKAEESAEG